MKKLISIRNVIIVILCITIICLGIGFIVLSLELKKAKNDRKMVEIKAKSLYTYYYSDEERRN